MLLDSENSILEEPVTHLNSSTKIFPSSLYKIGVHIYKVVMILMSYMDKLCVYKLLGTLPLQPNF